MYRHSLTSISIALCAYVLAGCQSSLPEPVDELSMREGLVRVENKSVYAAYKRPEASLAGYSKLLLRPIEVQFAKDWDPKSGGSALYRMQEPDREKIKRELAETFAEIFKHTMEKGGYSLVETSGPDVIEMRAAIVNLYITAPDVSIPAGTHVYTTDAGEMTLVMHLHDSVTGQLLARAYDRVSAGTGTWTWTNSVSNTAEAKQIISYWATALRKAFDAARATG